jgi:hypothetical protein
MAMTIPVIMILAALSAGAAPCTKCMPTIYVSPTGDDAAGDGSLRKPFATITRACDNMPRDGGTIIVLDGTYAGTQVVTGHHLKPVFIRAENPYRARLVSSGKRHRVLEIYDADNFIINGFEIAGMPGGADEYLVHIGSPKARRITLKNCIVHDGYNNDLVKIDDSARMIAIQGNVFYNQPDGGDEHLAIDSVANVAVEDNIFFNDFAGSSRENRNATGPYVLIKNSGDQFATMKIVVRRNVFLNWEGLPDQPMLLVGEDGKAFLEAEDVTIENNLFLLNSRGSGAGKAGVRRAALATGAGAFGVKGARRIVFRANTVSGDSPHGTFEYEARINREGKNPVNEDIAFYNNVWSSPSGTMVPFSAGRPEETKGAVLKRNLYWNGGPPGPRDGGVLEPVYDQQAVNADPRLGPPRNLVLPRWDTAGEKFLSGSKTIRQEFERLVNLYGAPRKGSPAIDAADPENTPADDILGRKRAGSGKPDLGCFEVIGR